MTQPAAFLDTQTDQPSWWQKQWPTAVVILLTFAAAAVRFWALDRLPLGIYRDEAYEGLDALQVLDGKFSLFFTANNGREPLFVYLISPLIAVFGRSALALRLLPALAGVLLIPAVYALGSELFGKPVGVFAAALASFSVWAVNLSRLALRATLLPVVTATMLLCLTRGLRLRRWTYMLGAGLALAAGLYTYLPARFMLATVAIYGFALLMRQRRTFWWHGWLALLLALVAAAAPLAGYYAAHPADFMGRSSQVSVFNPIVNQGRPMVALLKNLWHTFLGYFYRGDFIPRHNIPNRPFLEPLIALAFAGGLLVLPRYQRAQGLAPLVYLWLAMLSLPTVLAEGAPHMLRAVGLLPVLYLPAAVGLTWFSEHLRPKRASGLGIALAAVVVLQSSSSALLAYREHLNSEAVYYNFESGATQLAVEVTTYLTQESTTARRVLLDKRLWDNFPSLRFLLADVETLSVLNTESALLPDTVNTAENSVLLVLWPFADNSAALKLLPAGQVITVQEGALERGDLEADARLLYVSYSSSPPVSSAASEATWEHGITLMGHSITLLDADTLLVELTWFAQQAPAEPYTIYVHLLQGEVVTAQHDGPAAQGYYGTERWRAGDIIIDRHILKLTQPYKPQTDRLMLGLYHWPDMTPLKRIDGAAAGQDTLLLSASNKARVP